MCADERAFALSVCCQRASGLRQRSLRLDALALAGGACDKVCEKVCGDAVLTRLLLPWPL